jgi:hypothetical protein
MAVDKLGALKPGIVLIHILPSGYTCKEQISTAVVKSASGDIFAAPAKLGDDWCKLVFDVS